MLVEDGWGLLEIEPTTQPQCEMIQKHVYNFKTTYINEKSTTNLWSPLKVCIEHAEKSITQKLRVSRGFIDIQTSNIL